MAESNEQKKQAYIEQINLAEKLKGIVQETNIESDNALNIAVDLEEKLKDRIKSAEGVKALDEAISELLLEQARTKSDINQEMIDELTTTRDILKLEEERKDLMDGLNDKLKDAAGLNNDFVKGFMQGGGIGVGIVVATKALEQFQKLMDSTVGLAKDLYIETGASAAESGRMAGEVFKAGFSIEGLLYGFDGLANAAKESSEYFGTTRGITSEMNKNVAELTALTGDAASSVKLNAIFNEASGSAADMTDEIRAIATKEGVNANALFKQMAGSAGILVGASAEQLKNLAKATAELQKQGVSMQMMEEISGNVLNIESSLQAEMKARALGLDDMAGSANELRAAAMEFQFGDEATGMQMMGDALASANLNMESFGEMTRAEKEASAALMGTTVDGLSDMIIKQDQFQKLREKNPDLSMEELKAIQEQQEEMEAFKQSGISAMTSIGAAIGPLIGQFLVMKKVQTGSMFGGGKGPDVGKMKAPETPKNMDPKKSKGIKGFLKGLRDGLQSFAKGAGKTLLGALVLAGVVAILGAGFKVAMEILGDVDPVGMLAFSVSIGILGAALALMGAIGGNVIMGAAALAIVAVALIPAAFAFSLLENVDIGKMIAFSIMLPLLALAAAGLGFIAPFVMAGAAALMVLGLAIIPAAIAFGMLSDSNMEGIVDKLATLGQVAGPLLMVGAGLVSIAAGLALMGYMGVAALPVLGMMLALSAAAPALLAMGSLFGLGGGGDDSGAEESDPINYDKLATALASQPMQIVIDGKVVSEFSRIQNVRQSKKY